MSTNGLHPRDLDSFLKLSSALTLFLSDELTAEDVEKADQLLREYCIELLEVSIAHVPPIRFRDGLLPDHVHRSTGLA